MNPFPYPTQKDMNLYVLPLQENIDVLPQHSLCAFPGPIYPHKDEGVFLLVNQGSIAQSVLLVGEKKHSRFSQEYFYESERRRLGLVDFYIGSLKSYTTNMCRAPIHPAMG